MVEGQLRKRGGERDRKRERGETLGKVLPACYQKVGEKKVQRSVKVLLAPSGEKE